MERDIISIEINAHRKSPLMDVSAKVDRVIILNGYHSKRDLMEEKK